MKTHDTIFLPYGRERLAIDLSRPGGKFTVFGRASLESSPEIEIHDLYHSFENPIGSASLREVIHPEDSVCIVTSDGTRPFLPMRQMLHAILNHLGFVPEQTTVLTGSGSHRPHTEEELKGLFCKDLIAKLNVVSHDSRSGDNIEVGTLADGSPVTMNRHYVEADARIVLGHIEPHFFAGYTGGPKGIVPAICGITTIHRLHAFEVIDDETSTFGDIERNATMALIREAAACAPPDFLVNLVLDEGKKPVAVFSGDYIKAHRAGVAASRSRTELRISRRFPIVITSNSGHPLDQNLYQTVKGINTAAQLVEPGGIIIIVSECSQGIPGGSSFEQLLSAGDSVETTLRKLKNSKETIDDQWQVQRLCQILMRCRVILVSSLDEETTRRCKLGYARTVEDALESILADSADLGEVAVLVDGPLNVPVVDAESAR